MGEPRMCGVCRKPLPTADHGARRRKYHPECLNEGRRIQVAKRQGRDPARRPVGPKIAAVLASVEKPYDGGRAWAFYRDLLLGERTDVPYEEAVAALGGTRQRAGMGLAQLRRLELLVPKDGAQRPMYEVRPPTSAEARAWVAACAAGGRRHR